VTAPVKVLIRGLMLVVAFAHSFPASKHLALLAREPSLDEAWKGLGAVAAMAVCLLPAGAQLRGARWLLRRRRVMSGLAFVLAVAHLVPAADHLPLWVDAPSWGDGWRGIGALAAAVLFATPQAVRVRLSAIVVRMGRTTPVHAAKRSG
jgi:hypothetical protein